MQTLVLEVRYALRRLRSSPAFTIAAGCCGRAIPSDTRHSRRSRRPIISIGRRKATHSRQGPWQENGSGVWVDPHGRRSECSRSCPAMDRRESGSSGADLRRQDDERTDGPVDRFNASPFVSRSARIPCPHDPRIFLGAAAAFALIALGAASMPALRATRVNPARILTSA